MCRVYFRTSDLFSLWELCLVTLATRLGLSWSLHTAAALEHNFLVKHRGCDGCLCVLEEGIEPPTRLPQLWQQPGLGTVRMSLAWFHCVSHSSIPSHKVTGTGWLIGHLELQFPFWMLKGFTSRSSMRSGLLSVSPATKRTLAWNPRWIVKAQEMLVELISLTGLF